MSSAKTAFQTFLKILDGITPGGISTVGITAGGTGYTVGGILTVTTGGTGGTLKILTADAGIVSAVRLLTSGTNYTTGAGKATTVDPVGGTGCTINILTLGHQIAELQNINGPNQKVNLIDASNMDSPNGYSEFIAGMGEGGEISFDGNFLNDASQLRALTDFQAKTVRDFAVVVPLATPATWTFSGVFASLDVAAKHDDKLSFSGSVKISGRPTLA
jgi:predicted secreted protein